MQPSHGSRTSADETISNSIGKVDANARVGLARNPNSAWIKIAPTDGSAAYWVAHASTGLDGVCTADNEDVRRDTEPDEGVKDVQHGAVE